MSIFGSFSTASLGSSHPALPPARLHPPRPVLKRSRTPYTPIPESKKRRTSPTGAFSKLSISNHPFAAITPSSPPPPPSSLPSSSSFTLSSTDPSPTQAQPAFDQTPPCGQAQVKAKRGPEDQEIRMKSVYSAYELEPDRIYIESLSDDLNSSPSTPSSPTGGDHDQSIVIDSEISKKLISHQEKQRIRGLVIKEEPDLWLDRSNPDLTTHEHNQLVLYRKPDWPPLVENSTSSNHIIAPTYFNNRAQLDDMEPDTISAEPPVPEPPVPDSMDLD